MINTVKTPKPKKFKFEIKELDAESKAWFGVSYLIRCTNYDWFPTEMLMGINTKGRYYDQWEIGARITGNMGSMNIGVEDIVAAKKLLKL